MIAKGRRVAALATCHSTGWPTVVCFAQVVLPSGAVQGASSKDPSWASSMVGAPSLPEDRSLLYGSGRALGAGPVAVPLPWPVVVVNEYTDPGWIVTVNFPLTGVMSGCWTNHCDGLSLA